ncbi:flagellar basal body rod protein FlgB [Cucumibacter marinus]|uniref:flagellar basal body rod protein FlgB n=1 Tax=Cucumibacter marinus TaxID=1121252 RepID=UPI00040E6DA3|nr:flagellar basal body rod protein FlgB [Cucumibacter marinus]
MALGDMPILSALKQKMNWHQSRQTLLAENVANAETPGYRGRDLKPFSFEDHVNSLKLEGVETSATHKAHFAVHSEVGRGFGTNKLNSFEITPEGNGVTLEDEMMKVTSNQLDYQAATTLYTRSIRLIKTALGKG